MSFPLTEAVTCAVRHMTEELHSSCLWCMFASSGQPQIGMELFMVALSFRIWPEVKLSQDPQ